MADTKKKTDLSIYDGGFKGSDALTQAGVNKQNAVNAYAEALANGFNGSDALAQSGVNKQNAANAYQNWLNTGFSSDYTTLSKDALNAYNDHINKGFSYDVNADALYQQYKDKYIQQGKTAMQDTMGQAAAMTGGYGNSYAATVGNQAYQAQLNNLNDIIPELYQLAYDRYNQQGQNLLNQYSLYSDALDRDYGMWSDKGNLLSANRDYYGQEESNLYNREYGAWGDKMNLLSADRDYYGQEESNLYNREYGAWSDNRTYDQTNYWNEISAENAGREIAIKEAQEKRESEKYEKEKEKAETDYSDWDAADWEGYFATIRNDKTKGKAAAEAELDRMNKAGLIPKNMIVYASIGARGSLGH